MELITNWAVLIFITFILVGSVIVAIRKPSKQSIEAVKACLLNWVVQAEAMFGSGTGKVKLSDVYSQFVASFPDLSDCVPMDTFSEWVDEALDKMRNMLSSNKNLREVVGVEEGAKV